jgi:hypothetical protein
MSLTNIYDPQVQFHLKSLMSEMQQTNLEKTLLAWCRQHTKDYPGFEVRNFTTSWCDGLAFNALLHKHRPQLFQFEQVARMHPAARLEHAFSMAQMELGIERLLDPEGELSHIEYSRIFYLIPEVLMLIVIIIIINVYC